MLRFSLIYTHLFAPSFYHARLLRRNILTRAQHTAPIYIQRAYTARIHNTLTQHASLCATRRALTTRLLSTLLCAQHAALTCAQHAALTCAQHAALTCAQR